MSQITKRALTAASALLLGTSVSPVFAHTNSIGYVGDGQGGVTFWYGSWHSGTTFNEGELKLEGANGTSYTTTITQFNLIENSTPAGLDPGTNYFQSDGTQLVPYAAGANGVGGGSPSYTWQGFTVTGLSAGDYTFTYIPLGDAQSYQPTATPTMDWMPYDQVTLSNTISLSAGLISGDANGNGILDIYEFGTVTTPPPSSTPTVVSSAAGTPVVTTSTSSGTRTETSTRDRYVFNTQSDSRSYYVDTVVTTIPTTTTVTSTTPTTVDTYSDGSTVTTNGTTTTSSSTVDSGSGTSVVTQSTVPVWVETRTYDVNRSAYRPSGVAPSVTKTHKYTATEDGSSQTINHHTTTGVTTPIVRSVTTTAVYTKVYTDGSPDTVTTDPSVITYETSASYAEYYDSKDYTGRIDQHEVLDNIGGGLQGLLNHEPTEPTTDKVRVFNNTYRAWSHGDNGYYATSVIYGGGLEIDLKPTWTIGAQYNSVKIDLNGVDSTSELNKSHIGAFNMFRGNTFSLLTNAGLSKNNYHVSRTVQGVFNNESSTTGQEWWVNNKILWHAHKNITPFVGYTVGNYRRDAFTESGSIQSARSVDAVNETSHTGEIGLALSHRFGGKKKDMFGVSVEGSYATDNSVEVAASVDYRETIFVEGFHQISDGLSNTAASVKVKFKF